MLGEIKNKRHISINMATFESRLKHCSKQSCIPSVTRDMSALAILQFTYDARYKPHNK